MNTEKQNEISDEEKLDFMNLLIDDMERIELEPTETFAVRHNDVLISVYNKYFSKGKAKSTVKPINDEEFRFEFQDNFCVKDIEYHDEIWGRSNGKWINHHSKTMTMMDEEIIKSKHRFIPINFSYQSQQNNSEAIDLGGCSICGNKLVSIRGKYPGTERRTVCPTCNTERLEQINEISSKSYGVAMKNVEINIPKLPN